ncbi:unnamed protein product [Fusarium venenatum]|uniref:Uncharacterized protein n=1 Tax=Fusarium venenatum TaxID=56646 RepID=A0A2L2TQG1_9HYPO|nr:uncharacterized protein FVRRES_10930 [Fusarium venenatum]CEI70853.1 unnamed protein product [Fusarium venenatum]
MSSGENKLRPATTAGGHIEDRGQPALPVVHRRFANPSPLGLLSFATGIVLNPFGTLSPDFQQAIAIYIWAWFILTVIYTIAAVRSSWVLFLDLLALDICLILLAAGNMVNSMSVLNAGYAFGYLVAVMSYWAGCAGLFAGGVTPFEIPTFPMYKEA